MPSLDELAEVDVALLGGLVGDRTRLTMLLLLMDGRPRLAKELAYGSGVTPATASTHLKKLKEAGLLEAEKKGRYREFRLARPEVARMVEALLVAAPRRRRTERPAASPVPNGRLRDARMCYDHVAGRLGVAITHALVERRMLREERQNPTVFAITRRGHRWVEDLGIEVEPLRKQRRSFSRGCLDWSERCPHLAGALGAALATKMLAAGWIERVPRTRELDITPKGWGELRDRLGLSSLPRV